MAKTTSAIVYVPIELIREILSYADMYMTRDGRRVIHKIKSEKIERMNYLVEHMPPVKHTITIYDTFISSVKLWVGKKIKGWPRKYYLILVITDQVLDKVEFTKRVVDKYGNCLYKEFELS